MLKFVKSVAIALAATVAISSFAPATSLAATYTAQQTPAHVTAESIAFETEILRLTNEFRVANGLYPVAYNATLSTAARNHNLDMINNNFLSHTGSNGSASYDRALAVGYQPYGWGVAYVGENIAAGHNSPQAAFNGWLNSPSHRANMLRPEYRELGVAVNFGGTYGTYVTQNFGAAPNSFPVFVNNGAATVNSTNVSLTVTNETVSNWGSMGAANYMRVSENPNFSGANWTAYSPVSNYQLSSGAGAKTLYVQIQDANGNTNTANTTVTLNTAVASN